MEPIWLRNYPPAVPAHGDYPAFGLFDMFAEAASEFADVACTRFMGRDTTYAEMLSDAERLSAVLHGLGVGRGDRVGIVLPNTPMFVAAYFATLRLGAVAVANNPLYTERELDHQLTDAGCRVVITLDMFFAKVDAVACVEQIIVTSITDCLPFPKKVLYPLKAAHDKTAVRIPSRDDVHRWHHALTRAGDVPPAVQVDPCRDLAALVYTGGTTGVSKGVMLTHRNLVVNACQAQMWMPQVQRGGERMLALLPFFHAFGMTVCMLVTIRWAGTMLVMPRFDLDELLDLIVKDRPTFLPAVPTIFVAIANHPDAGKLDLTSVRSCFSGAAPLPAEVMERFEQLTGATIVEGYGLTETSPICIANPPEGLRKPATIGIPLPDTEAKLVDLDTGEEVTGSGELCIRGPQVMQGYWNRPDETANVLGRDGWLRTGDIATVDSDGYFSIVDRAKEMIITGGFNVYPREVEEVLYTHPAVKEAAVVGLPHEYLGEQVAAFVVLKDGTQASGDEIVAHCRIQLGAYKVPRTVYFRADLPKSIVGKVLRRKLREEYGARQ